MDREAAAQAGQQQFERSQRNSQKSEREKRSNRISRLLLPLLDVVGIQKKKRKKKTMNNNTRRERVAAECIEPALFSTAIGLSSSFLPHCRFNFDLYLSQSKKLCNYYIVQHTASRSFQLFIKRSLPRAINFYPIVTSQFKSETNQKCRYLSKQRRLLTGNELL